MTPAQTQAARAESLLAEIKPELLKLLENAPAFGSCGIDVFLHENEIVRFAVRAEVSRKPRTGGRL
jgi:hypothetical protein